MSYNFTNRCVVHRVLCCSFALINCANFVFAVLLKIKLVSKNLKDLHVPLTIHLIIRILLLFNKSNTLFWEANNLSFYVIPNDLTKHLPHKLTNNERLEYTNLDLFVRLLTNKLTQKMTSELE